MSCKKVTYRFNYRTTIVLSLSRSLQNAAARLLTGFNRRHYITQIMAALHWLPVRFRIDLKILLISFKAHLGLAPGSITEMFTHMSQFAALDLKGWAYKQDL